MEVALITAPKVGEYCRASRVALLCAVRAPPTNSDYNQDWEVHWEMP